MTYYDFDHLKGPITYKEYETLKIIIDEIVYTTRDHNSLLLGNLLDDIRCIVQDYEEGYPYAIL